MINQWVIIRTRDAGVHIGLLQEKNDATNTVILRSARRLWRWKGANTLNEVALHGVDRKDFTRISEVVSQIQINCVCEILSIECENPEKMFAPVWS